MVIFVALVWASKQGVSQVWYLSQTQIVSLAPTGAFYDPLGNFVNFHWNSGIARNAHSFCNKQTKQQPDIQCEWISIKKCYDRGIKALFKYTTTLMLFSAHIGERPGPRPLDSRRADAIFRYYEFHFKSVMVIWLECGHPWGQPLCWCT